MKILNAIMMLAFLFVSYAHAIELAFLPNQKISPKRAPITKGDLGVGSGKPSMLGISNVGNGGGLAEMRLIYLHQNLNRFLKICLTDENNCHLPLDTKSEWQTLSTNQGRDGAYYIISFEPKIENEKGFIITGTQLKISSQQLYVDLETPKKFGEILAFLIAVRQDLLGSKSSFANNLKLANDVFANLQVEESMYRVTNISSLLRLAQLKVNDGLQSHYLISIEDQEKTLDLAALVTKALPCGTLKDWSFSQWNSTVGPVGYLYGFANGQCDGIWQQKRIVIQFGLDSKLLIQPKDIEIQFFIN